MLFKCTTALINVANDSQLGIKIVYMTEAVSAFADGLMLITDEQQSSEFGELNWFSRWKRLYIIQYSEIRSQEYWTMIQISR